MTTILIILAIIIMLPLTIVALCSLTMFLGTLVSFTALLAASSFRLVIMTVLGLALSYGAILILCRAQDIMSHFVHSL